MTDLRKKQLRKDLSLDFRGVSPKSTESIAVRSERRETTWPASLAEGSFTWKLLTSQQLGNRRRGSIQGWDVPLRGPPHSYLLLLFSNSFSCAFIGGLILLFTLVHSCSVCHQSTVGGIIPWAGDPGLIKARKLSEHSMAWSLPAFYTHIPKYCL